MLCFKPVRQQESLHHWKGGPVVEDALMHCGSEDKQTLWCITGGGRKHKQARPNVANAVLGRVKLKVLPPIVHNPRGSSNLHFFLCY